MEFSRIADLPEFFKRVEGCRGSVSYVDEQGKMQDLKIIAQNFNKLLPFVKQGELHGLQVSAGNRDDGMNLVRFMSEMNYGADPTPQHRKDRTLFRFSK